MRDRVAAENEERRERESGPKKVIEFECEKLVIEILVNLDKENLFNKLSKCKFFKTEVNWLRSFFGSINHLSKFIPNAANPTDKLRPLSREENEKKNGKKFKNTSKEI